MLLNDFRRLSLEVGLCIIIIITIIKSYNEYRMLKRIQNRHS